ncbi:hypothetical protein [Luteolibacter soli]|uniref:Uncharacterized protein n=1 Tax=Luteolibacter soli TaxID=3135280 RepID=A0ABU9B4I9_9BACT
MSDALAELVFLSLDHAVASVGEGGPLIPFLIIEKDGDRTLSRFMADHLEDSVAQGRLALSQLPEGTSAYAFAYDGYVTVEGQRNDAVIVEASEVGKSAAIQLAQRYSAEGGNFQTIGNAAFLGECSSHLP